MPTKIEWTQETWNPITGCTPISEGCQNCYARRAAYSGRLRGRFGYPQDEPFGITYHPDKLDRPLRWHKARTIFVCSMSDLMHESIAASEILQVLQVMKQAPDHRYYVLTKRAARLIKFLWPASAWVGVTVEHPKYLDRIDRLRDVETNHRFVSFEPLLDWPDEYPIRNLDLSGIDWVIVGAETGPRKRPMDRKAAAWIRDNCIALGIPFFFKRDSDGSRELIGKRWEQMP